VSFPGSAVHHRAGWVGGSGVQAVYGATVVENHGGSPVRIDAARLVGDVPTDAAGVTDTRVVILGPVPGRGDLVGATAWPLHKPFLRTWWRRAEPAIGATLGPNQAAELVYVVKVNEDGDWYWPQTALDYQVNGIAYTTSTNFGFQVCSKKPRECRAVE